MDRKREELREMVGERYRDLIEAADTIQNMRTTAGQVPQAANISGERKTNKDKKSCR